MIIIVVMSLSGSVLGLLRESLFAAIYGTSVELETFVIASTLPILMLPRISKAIISAYIPFYLSDNNKEYKEFKYITLKKYLEKISFVVLVLFLLFSIVLFLTSKNLLYLHMIVLSIAIYFILKSSLLIAMHNLYDSFVKPAFSNFLINIFLLFFLLISVLLDSILWLSIGLSSYAVFQYYYLQKNAPYKTVNSQKIRKQKVNISEFNSLFLSSFLAAISIIIPTIIVRLLNSFLNNGDIVAFNYAYLVISLFPMLFSVTLLPVLAPKLSHWKNNNLNVGEMLNKILLLIIAAIFPIQLILLIFSDEIVDILFARGAFSSHAAVLTTKLISIMSLTIIFRIFNELFLRYLLALNNKVTTLVANRNYIVVSLVITPILTLYYGIEGAAISIVLIELYNSSYYLFKSNKNSEFNLVILLFYSATVSSILFLFLRVYL